MLNVTNRSQMQNLFPFVPHLYVPQRQTRLFPTSYINALNGHLNGRSATLALVRQFNTTADARRLIVEMQADLTAAIDQRKEHTPAQVADILSVARATVSGWIKSGTLAFSEKRLHKGEIVPMGPRQRRVMGRQFITPQMIRDATRWVMPG